MTKEEVMTLIESCFNRFLMEAPPYCDLNNAMKLALHAGFSSPWDPVFVDALKQLDQDKVIYYIGKDACFFLLNEEYLIPTFTRNGTADMNSIETRLIEEIRSLKKKYLV